MGLIGGASLSIGGGNGAAKGGALQKAYIIALEPPAIRVEFPFNPKELRLDRAITWGTRDQGGVDAPQREYSRGEPRRFDVSIVVDEYERGGDVRLFVHQLEMLCEAHPANGRADSKPRPPYVRFGWGAMLLFLSIITKLNVHFTLFHPDGRPARASIDIGFDEVMEQLPGQNPTSAGAALHLHTVLPGETLDRIAYTELGDAALWRRIAEATGLDNPLAITPGQQLMIGR
jgi:nucleoid-associated protein YgaU